MLRPLIFPVAAGADLTLSASGGRRVLHESRLSSQSNKSWPADHEVTNTTTEKVHFEYAVDSET